MTARATPDISIVIVSWNRREDLLRALESCARQRGVSIEIVVVDNGSADGTPEAVAAWAKTAPVPLAFARATSNLGAAVARNAGIRLSTGGTIAFLDSDAELCDDDTLARLRGTLRGRKLAGVGPAIYLDRERTAVWYKGGYYLRGMYVDMGRNKVDHETPEFLTTCCSLWERDAVERAGGFDPALPYGFEDNDLSHRVQRAGGVLAVDPQVAAIHHLSQAARIRAERDGMPHYVYDERARIRVSLRRHGFLGFVREEAWQWSAAGRKQRFYIYLQSGIGRWKLRRMFAVEALRGVLLAPAMREKDWIAEAPIDRLRVERPAAAGG